MSFSSNVKAELCKDSMGRKSCAVAESYGVLLYCNTFTSAEIRIITESRDFAARLPKLFKRAFGVSFDAEPAPEDRGKLQFAITAEDKIAKIFDTLQMDLKSSLTLHVNFGMLEEETECIDLALRYGKQKDTDWRYGKIIAGDVTPEFCVFLLGLPKPTDTELYNKMTPFFTIALDNGFCSEHYGTELNGTGWQASNV